MFGDLLPALRSRYDLFDNWFDGSLNLDHFFGSFSPSFDIEETNNSFILTGEIAGVKPEDLDISIDKEILTVRGEKKKEDKGYKRIERAYGSFQRSWNVGKDIDTDNIDAEFKDGILKITLPKIENVRKEEKKIKVKG